MVEWESETTGPTDKLRELRTEENALLLENGFESVQINDLLWVRSASTTVGRLLYR
jgi:hypothetical protein